MWVKYESICTNCDSLFEVTSMNPLVSEPVCICSNPHVIRINKYDVTVKTVPENYMEIDTIEMLDSFKNDIGIEIDSLDVMKVTRRGLVKINTNPYN